MTACTHGQPLWHHLAAGDICPVCRTTIVSVAVAAATGHRGGVDTEAHPQAALECHPPATIATGVAPHRERAGTVLLPFAPTTAPVAAIATPAPTPATPCPALRLPVATPSANARHGAGAAPSLFDVQVSPNARMTDPDTAHDAAGAVTDVHRRNVYRAVLEALVEHGPCTDHDLARYVSGKLGHPIGQTSCGKRRGELRDSGLVADSGFRGKTPTGATAIRWALTPAGIDATGGVAA